MSSTLNFLGTHKISDREHHGRVSTFNHKNGYSIPKPLGASPDQMENSEIEDLGAATLRLTYGNRVGHRQGDTQKLPNFVVLDKKVLYFKAYMKSTVHESQLENHRVRFLKLYYYLEDDTISICEPQIENSGLPQGPFLTRMQLPKSDGSPYHWTDLNVGSNVEVFGKVLRLYECNNVTRTFLTAEGIVVPDSEEPPVDPYAFSRKAVDHPNFVHATASDFDKFKQFLVLDRKVLRFFAKWEDPSSPGRQLTAVVFYFLVDDTIEIREIHDANDGRDPFPVFLGRCRVPRNPKDLPPDFPTSTLEVSEIEVPDHINPADLSTGKDVTIYGRSFYLYDCDAFTKDFYKRNFHTDMPSVDVSAPAQAPLNVEIPPYNGIGTPEDSYLSCVSINPTAPSGTKSLLQLLKYENKLLRFEAEMDSAEEHAAGRKFIVSFRLADEHVSVYEPFGSASDGGFGGTYLSFQLLYRPGTDPDQPKYLNAGDFYVGARIKVYGVDFILTSADRSVVDFMEQHQSIYSEDAIEATRNHIA